MFDIAYFMDGAVHFIVAFGLACLFLTVFKWLYQVSTPYDERALIAANNLTDLADTAAARGNLGLGTMATAVAGTGSTQFQTNAQNDADFQPLSATLTTLSSATAAGLALMDDANAAAQLVTLGLTATAAEINALDGLSTIGEIFLGAADGAAQRAILGFSQVTGTPRRLVLPGGMIIQGGSGTTTTSGVTVTFPLAFSVSTTFVLGTLSAGGNALITFSSLTATSVFVEGKIASSGTPVNVQFHWIAFGE